MGRRDGSAPLTSRLRGLAGAPMTLFLLIRNARFEAPILPPETGHVQEQIGKSVLLTALLTNCLPPDSRKLELFNYFKMVGEEGLERSKP
jgi:hypothetical protein